MISADSVLEMAQNGDEYSAVERSSIVVRKLKQQKKYNEASLFLMDLALTLQNGKKHVPAAVTAQKAIDFLGEIDHFRAPDDFQKKVFLFIENLTPESTCFDLCKFMFHCHLLYGKENRTILSKLAFIADKAEFYNEAQAAYILLLFEQLDKKESTDKTAQLLIDLLWRWTYSIQDETSRIFTGQYIFARALLGLSGRSKDSLNLAVNILQKINESTDKELLSQPLFVFVKYFFKALLQNSPASAKLLSSKFEKLLKLDGEFSKLITKNRQVHFNEVNPISQLMSNSLDGLNQMVQTLMGALGMPQSNL